MISSLSVDKRFIFRLLTVLASLSFLSACSEDSGSQTAMTATTAEGFSPSLEAAESDFVYEADRFADIRILRYQVPGFDDLSDQQKELLYYLSQAALSGRDIMYDQNYKHNLRIRRTIEEILKKYDGDRDTKNFSHLTRYAKQVWFANGIHHHYSGLKFTPPFDEAYFNEIISATADHADFPLREGQSVEQLIAELTPILFDQTLDPKKVNTADGIDKVASSAVNFYEGVTEHEVIAFYATQSENDDSCLLYTSDAADE